MFLRRSLDDAFNILTGARQFLVRENVAPTEVRGIETIMSRPKLRVHLASIIGTKAGTLFARFAEQLTTSKSRTDGGESSEFHCYILTDSEYQQLIKYLTRVKEGLNADSTGRGDNEQT